MGQLLDLAVPPHTVAQPGKALGAPATAAATLGMVYGPNGWIYPPGYLTVGRAAIGAGLSNTSAEASLFTGPASRAFPAMVAVDDCVDIEAAGKWVNNSGSNSTLAINVYMAGTQIASYAIAAQATSASQRPWVFRGRVYYVTLGGAGAGAVAVVATLLVGGVGTGVQAQQANSTSLLNDGASATVATNVDATGEIKAQASQATSQSVVIQALAFRHYPKNY